MVLLNALIFRLALFSTAAVLCVHNTRDGTPFPFSSGRRNYGREARLDSCVMNCVCSDIRGSYFVIDCSLAANQNNSVQIPLPSSSILSNFTGSNKEFRLLIMGSELEYLQENAFQGIQFNKIHIKYNHGLSDIPNQVLEGSKSVLNVLDLRNNNFSSFPVSNLSVFRNLEFISFNDNRIREIPSRISGQERLVHLGVANNKIDKIASGALINLPRLKFLDLHGNLLTVLSSPFHGLDSLHSLILFDNPLKIINPGILKELSILEILNLSFCSLKHLRNGELEIHTQKSLHLDLARNPLESIELSAFQTESLPLWLNLRGTNVKLLQENDFRPILERMVSTSLVHERYGQPQLMMEDVELSCDCSVKWLATNSTLLDRVVGLCVHKNLPVRRLDPDYFYRFCF